MSHSGAKRVIVERGESWWSGMGWFWNLPLYRPYKLDLQGAGCAISYHTVRKRVRNTMHASQSHAMVPSIGHQSSKAVNQPIFKKLYQSVHDGTETHKSLELNGRSTYSELQK